jgi:hypothetical protein
MSSEKQHASVKDLQRPNLPIAKRNDAHYSTDHITSGAAKTPHKIQSKDKREPSPIMYPDMPAPRKRC